MPAFAAFNFKIHTDAPDKKPFFPARVRLFHLQDIPDPDVHAQRLLFILIRFYYTIILRGVQPDASFKKFSGLKQQITGNLLTKSILRIMMMQTAN